MTEVLHKLGVATALGAVAIVVLVVIAWRAVERRRRHRSRPASPEADDERRRLLRQIAASDYRPKRHDKDSL